jgi:hypothetical protein
MPRNPARAHHREIYPLKQLMCELSTGHEICEISFLHDSVSFFFPLVIIYNRNCMFNDKKNYADIDVRVMYTLAIDLLCTVCRVIRKKCRYIPPIKLMF